MISETWTGKDRRQQLASYFPILLDTRGGPPEGPDTNGVLELLAYSYSAQIVHVLLDWKLGKGRFKAVYMGTVVLQSRVKYDLGIH